MYIYGFCFPKAEGIVSKDLKSFTDGNSFPVLSINVTPRKRTSEFVSFKTKSAEKETKFRSRNNFIIARSTLASLLKENTYELKIISKGVSRLWGQADSSFKTYFEYLSITESVWHDRKKMTYSQVFQNKKSHAFNNTGSSADAEKSKNKFQSQPLKHKFRLKKSSIRMKRPKIRRYTSGFKISSSSLSCNYGIVTEDVFK